MSWKNSVTEVYKKQTQPMHQVTYWVLFLATGLVYTFKTVETAAAASYDLIVRNPEIASGSWLANGMFY